MTVDFSSFPLSGAKLRRAQCTYLDTPLESSPIEQHGHNEGEEIDDGERGEHENGRDGLGLVDSGQNGSCCVRQLRVAKYRIRYEGLLGHGVAKHKTRTLVGEAEKCGHLVKYIQQVI